MSQERDTFPDTAEEQNRHWRTLIPMLALVVFTLIAYLPSLDGRFVYDDLSNIVDNSAIRQVWPPTPWIDTGRRPLTNFTFALNHAAGGLDPLGYRLVNVGVHMLTALALFSLIARTARLCGWRPSDARSLAFASALLFSVHPLATQGVTYIVQRGESLMALFYVLVLLCLARSVGSGRAWLWLALSACCGALGMASKAVMVTAPVAALLYDRVYLSGSFTGALRARRWYYAALLAGASVLFFWHIPGDVFDAPDDTVATVGFSYEGITPLEYLLTQGGVILYYLRLVVWPADLRLDYHWPVVGTLSRAWPAVLPVGVMAIASGWFAVVRGAKWAFPAFAFFLVLAPTSSFIPIKHLAFEHRMYLPLASALVLLVLGAGAIAARFTRTPGPWLIAFALVASAALVPVTRARNAMYADPVALWSANVALEPDSPASHTNYAMALRETGDLESALAHYRAAAELDPTGTDRHLRVGVLASEMGRHALAVGALETAEEMMERRIDGAHPALVPVLKREERLILTRYAGALLRAGDRESAKKVFARAIETDSEEILPVERATALASLASLHQSDGQFYRAIPLYERAVGNSPNNADFLARLGRCYAEVGDLERARETLRRALRIDPSHDRAARVLQAITPKSE